MSAPVGGPPSSRRPRLSVLALCATVVVVAGVVGLFPALRDEGRNQPPRAPTALPRALPRAPAPVAPEAFGAVGNGRKDDSAALQRAINVAVGRGARVRLAPNRTYVSSRAIRLPSGTTLAGSGPTSVLRFTWTRNKRHTDGFYLGNLDQVRGNSHITIRDLAVRGAGSGLPLGPNSRLRHPAVPGIRLRAARHFLISGVLVSHVPGVSILYQGSSHGLVTGNHVRNSGRDGITGTSIRPTRADVVVADNLVERVGDDAFAVIGKGRTTVGRRPADRVVVRDNRVRGWRHNPNGLQLGRGIAVLGLGSAVVADNDIRRTKSDGILVTDRWGRRGHRHHGHARRPGDRIMIVRNQIVGAGLTRSGTRLRLPGDGVRAIDVIATRHVVVAGNRTAAGPRTAVRVRRCSGCLIRY